MSNVADVGGHTRGFGATTRTDQWWVGPTLTLAGLVAWGIYYTWAALQAQHYYVGPYLSPFYAPLLFTDITAVGSAPVEHAWFGVWPSWWPEWIPASPALLIFLFPATFRATCYYYRKAYYRSFFGTPPACAVQGVPLNNYTGETTILIFQNLHRYTLYFALLLLPILFYEAAQGFFYNGQFGVGVGSVIILVNAILLTGYTLGCHAWRHLVGGQLNCFSCGGIERARFNLWRPSSWLNARHMQFAWLSLYWILFADLYVRLVSMGVITDLNTWGAF
ncbi:MAG: succinate dehydrogenase [Myxococcota bacterium]